MQTIRVPQTPQWSFPVSHPPSPRALKTIIAMSGLWAISASQWRLTREYLLWHNYSLKTSDYPGRGDNPGPKLRTVGIDECIEAKIRELKAVGRPVPIIDHSFGIVPGAKIAEAEPGLVSGIIAIAHCPIRHCRLPLSHVGRLARPEYIPGFFGTFRLNDEDTAFVLDGSQTEIGPESGKIMREFTLGYRIPRFSELKCRTALIIPLDDSVIPRETSAAIARYHGIRKPYYVPGGHYAHCDPRTSEGVSAKIVEILKEWGE